MFYIILRDKGETQFSENYFYLVSYNAFTTNLILVPSNLETEIQHLHRPANDIKTEDSCEACCGNTTSCYSETN